MAGHFLLFAYGTLKRGQPRHHHLAGQRFVGPACTAPGYALLDLGAYPGLVPSQDDGVVHGELYCVEYALRALLDQIEGAPDLYQLEPIDLAGVAEPVFTYVYQRDASGRARLMEGAWPAARGERHRPPDVSPGH